ncbi:MAG: hypothetical protein VXZ72_01615 [Chlamydiota bacterium]|nr:hypothetical protein [Chlamydiota bacterium]
MPGDGPNTQISFDDVIKNYAAMQQQVVDQVKDASSDIKSANPSKFLQLQFAMAQVTQVGDSISNLVSQVNSMINNAVRNQKGG